MRLAWARRQLRAGLTVWSTPEVFTWDAWLVRQWRRAQLRGAAPTLQLLGPSQERELWQQVLRDMEADDVALAPHATALIRAATQAAQSVLELARSAASDEERLLVDTLAAVRRRCEAQGLLSPRLATPEMLHFLRDSPPPAITGQPRLTGLQQALQHQCWPDVPLLLPASESEGTAPRLLRFADLEAELAACAQWCLARLRTDGAMRLLLITACGQPSLEIQAGMLWRALGGTAADDQGRHAMLAVEGGTPLHRLGLVADALGALDCLLPQVEAGALLAMLRSPRLRFGSQLELWQLQCRFENWGRARWAVPALLEALAEVAGRDAAAARLHDWLLALRSLTDGANPHRTTEWARRFSEALAAAGFMRGPGRDSREQQRLDRWSALLDEFAALDAVLPPMDAATALRHLKMLAAESRHQPASADAAITFTDALADPVVGYDGIWVLGLAESRWPAPPRPDAYVSLLDQRRHHWPASSAFERRAQAQWALSRWRQCTGELVLSHPAMEADLRHRPATLPGIAGPWEEGPSSIPQALHGLARPFTDTHFPVIEAGQLDRPLRGGVERLRIQRDCPFRAHAQWRLKAMPPEALSDGLTAPSRGMLLHRMLEGVWGDLRDQATLLGLDPVAEAGLIERHWREATSPAVLPASRWWSEGLRERERRRTHDILAQVLRLERARAPFTVQQREVQLEWPPHGARLQLRIDRVDRTPGGEGILIDYKSGSAGRIGLHEGELEPLQLALYVAALAARGDAVHAAALFSLKPGEIGLAGVAAAGTVPLPGTRPVEDWPAQADRWRQELLALLASHLAGDGTLARDPSACRHCHLPALCRRAALEDVEEDADE